MATCHTLRQLYADTCYITNVTRWLHIRHILLIITLSRHDVIYHIYFNIITTIRFITAIITFLRLYITTTHAATQRQTLLFLLTPMPMRHALFLRHGCLFYAIDAARRVPRRFADVSARRHAVIGSSPIVDATRITPGPPRRHCRCRHAKEPRRLPRVFLLVDVFLLAAPDYARPRRRHAIATTS